MKKHLIIPILSFILSLASAGTACAELKVGTVDMKKIFESYWKTKDAETTMSNTRSTLKRDLDERMEKRKELQDSIEKLNDEIKKPELAQATAQKKALWHTRQPPPDRLPKPLTARHRRSPPENASRKATRPP